MLIWEDIDANVAQEFWDTTLLRSPDYNLYQCFSWGEYKRQTGWMPWRLWARDDQGKIVSLVQISMKFLPAGFSFGWCSGGPIVISQLNDDLDSSLDSLLMHIRRSRRRCYVRFDNYLPRDQEPVSIFEKHLRPSRVKLNSAFSALLDLDEPIDGMIDRLASKHHRRDLARSLRYDIEWKFGNCPEQIDALSELSEQMTREKKQRFPALSHSRIAALGNAFQQNAVIVTGYLDGAPVSSCLTLTFGTKSVYIAAAANSEGRRVYASYSMVHRLLQHLQSLGVKEFDFGGLDPNSPAAAGVDYFKRGFGGRLTERMGEWEWASSAAVRWMFNLTLAARKVQQ